MPFEERDVTKNPQHMGELKALMGRFITPTIVIGKEVLLGFGPNLDRINRLVDAKPRV